MSNPLGPIFSDELRSGRYRSKASLREMDLEEPDTTHRIMYFLGAMILGMGILFLRIFHLTVVKGDYFRKLAEDNRTREIKLPSPRGIIYDRNNKPLVRNIPVFITKDNEYVFGQKPPGNADEVVESVTREYIYSDLFAHVLGYIGEANEDELKEVHGGGQDTGRKPALTLGDMVGKMGIEKQYDYLLRGENGKQMYEVDSGGNTVRILGKVDPVPGKNIMLNLDLSLQEKAKEAMGGKKGAVVVSDPKTGEILALYSSPSFNPDDFVKREDVEKYFQDQDMPLFDRAISGEYPPGSTFKIVTSIAALSEGAITKDTQIEDTGILRVGDFSFGNWNFLQYGKTEGYMNIVTAIRRSNDIFFYKVGEQVGVRKISDWARKLGLGSPLGIDEAGEAKGLVSDPDWLEQAKGQKWYLGNTYHYSIGQGDLLATPLQVNTLTNIIASSGKLCAPRIMHTPQSASGREKNPVCRDLGINPAYIELVKEGMKGACSTGGTAYPLFNFQVKGDKSRIDGTDFLAVKESTVSANSESIGVSLACKTGTAEFGDPKGKTHAWLTVFAPVGSPQISVTVLVEAGGEGSTVAAPIAKQILESWFQR